MNKMQSFSYIDVAKMLKCNKHSLKKDLYNLSKVHGKKI